MRKLIEGKAISQANFRLAHVLLEKSITNLVITPNFDDFVSRALALFGKQHIVCDHPRTVERIDPEQDDIQIVHVHGSYWFYDCCNLRGELEQRAESSSQTTQTMAFLLDNILSHRSPIVLGYGGWEGDVIMGALRRRLQSRLPYNVYWFCYKRSHLEQLPQWLKISPDVHFVVPPVEVENKELSVLSVREAQEEDKLESLGTASMERTGKPTQDSSLTAQQVLDGLIERCGLKAPELTLTRLGSLPSI